MPESDEKSSLIQDFEDSVNKVRLTTTTRECRLTETMVLEIVRVLFENSTSPFIVPPKYLTNERLLDPSTDVAAKSTKAASAIFRFVPEERSP